MSLMQVFSTEQEAQLECYIKRASDIYFGKTIFDIRSLALQFAISINATFPSTWSENMMAGKDWMWGFLKRHPSLSIRRPQATSSARATSFNKNNVDDFFKNLSGVIVKFKIPPEQVRNMDETGITTVQRPDWKIARRGRKQVGALTSVFSPIKMMFILSHSLYSFY